MGDAAMVAKYLDFILNNKKKLLIFISIISFLFGYFGFFKIGINPDITNVVDQSKPVYRMQIDFWKKKATTNILTVALYCEGDVEEGKEVLKELKEKFEASGYISETIRFDVPELAIKYGIFSINSGLIGDFVKYFENLKRNFRMSPVDFRFWRILGVTYGKLENYIEDYIKRRGFNEYVLVSPNKKMIIMNFRLKKSTTDVDFIVEAIENLQKITANLERKSGYKIGLTGSPVFTYESTLQVKKDFITTTILSLSLICILLYLTLGSFYSVGVLLLAMLSSMAISMGIYYLLFREINIITSFVNAMVLGLGIDFGVHIVTRTNTFIKDGANVKEAIALSISHTFRPSMIAGLTSAIAFLTMIFSASPTFSQMGLMTAIGIGVFFTITYFLIPLLYTGLRISLNDFRLFDRFIKTVDNARKKIVITSLFTILILFFSFYGLINISNYWYTSPGLLPKDSEAFKILEDIEKTFGSVGKGEIAIAVGNIKELTEIEKKLKETGDYSSVYSIVDAIGDFSPEALKNVKKIYGDLTRIIWDPVISTIFRKVGMYKQIIEMLKLIETAEDVKRILAEVEKDLPMFFYTYGDKTYLLLYVNPKVDLYTSNNLKPEILKLKKLAGDNILLGYPVFFYYIMEEMKTSIKNVAIFIGIFIMLTILIGTKSFKVSVLSLMVICLSVLATFGVAYFQGIHATFMTLLVIPIMLGIGVDGMVHLYHTEKLHSEELCRTEEAVTISMLTTIAAFGSFAVAQGQLLKNFGINVAIGLFITMITSFFIFLPLIERGKNDV